MPYIRPENRIALDPLVDQLYEELDRRNFAEGDLNYCITRLLVLAWQKAPGYGLANRFRGVLGCIWDDFNRRYVAPYEDRKCRENGDII